MSQIRHLIGQEIASSGVISAARFMELALYCPKYGFYEAEPDTIGRRGHYFTSVSAGPLFGELLAFQFARWLEDSGSRAPTIAEAGAHDGKLARDILNWLQVHRPALYETVRYLIFEKSARRKAWQEETLQDHGGKVHWIEGLPVAGKLETAILFGNELLDAFPVHRLEWRSREGQWVEWGVRKEGETFVWAEMPQVSEQAARMLPAAELSQHLPEGYLIEVSPAALEWWKAAAASLQGGWLLTFDYGLTEEDRFAPERTGGTLRAYQGHRVSTAVLDNPGEQDLTAHVDFEAIRHAGEAAGLQTVALTSQGRFLTRIAAEAIQSGVTWDTSRIRQLNTLTHPDHLGASFKVLVQGAR